MKEPYVKPEMKSEVLEPEALTNGGSGTTNGVGGDNPLSGVCPDGVC